MLVRFIRILAIMGLLVSPAPRMTLPRMTEKARKIMGEQQMPKYRDASRYSSGSAPSHAGRKGLIPTMRMPRIKPSATAK